MKHFSPEILSEKETLVSILLWNDYTLEIQEIVLTPESSPKLYQSFVANFNVFHIRPAGGTPLKVLETYIQKHSCAWLVSAVGIELGFAEKVFLKSRGPTPHPYPSLSPTVEGTHP